METLLAIQKLILDFFKKKGLLWFSIMFSLGLVVDDNVSTRKYHKKPELSGDKNFQLRRREVYIVGYKVQDHNAIQ